MWNENKPQTYLQQNLLSGGHCLLFLSLDQLIETVDSQVLISGHLSESIKKYEHCEGYTKCIPAELKLCNSFIKSSMSMVRARFSLKPEDSRTWSTSAWTIIPSLVLKHNYPTFVLERRRLTKFRFTWKKFYFCHFKYWASDIFDHLEREDKNTSFVNSQSVTDV